MPRVFSTVVLVMYSVIFTMGASAANFDADIVDQSGKPLHFAVLTLQGPSGNLALALKADMDQRDQQFEPHVLAVHSGTQVAFPNSDNVRHQVYSFSPAKRFELRLYGGTPSLPVLFDKPGVVVLGCNIHDSMLGYIYVTDDPWFAVSGGDGAIKFDQLPAGHYKVTLWHPDSPDMQSTSGGEIDVPVKGLRQRFTLTVQPKDTGTDRPPASSAFGDAFNKAAHE
ncbi:methylamine utilization protein [Pseudomonas sp. 10B1]|uniref:methylamine utilization protein n=1 Tax=unclassified Pseudomonas TaxID=196821 RepID=UPI002AB4EEDC|nr:MULTISPECIES: methylamine utilization protein [unclassified Pseudomonas]MDY7561665.1 methylamine utilization protein [Pseudomonas sp. AB6]MEA9978185.1 methylamine utilization protein [Pseudomonas sp. RTS4]MEA9994630.1 methylamine utilization protein [Pseudomonas sp. AA4]MEB0085775.1 methylamine utilization protein [Pseudomonas sp. RTI1]MEB0125900.1 methylamine utilization protein [Pseudomonas sp. CCC1.2]